MTFTREQILAIVEQVPLELLDRSLSAGSCESSQKMRRHDLLVWFTRRLDGWVDEKDDAHKNRILHRR